MIIRTARTVVKIPRKLTSKLTRANDLMRGLSAALTGPYSPLEDINARKCAHSQCERPVTFLALLEAHPPDSSGVVVLVCDEHCASGRQISSLHISNIHRSNHVAAIAMLDAPDLISRREFALLEVLTYRAEIT